MAYALFKMHLALVMACIFVEMHLTQLWITPLFGICLALAMTYVLVKMSLTLVIAYVPIKTCLASAMAYILKKALGPNYGLFLSKHT